MELQLAAPEERHWVITTLKAMAVDTVGVLPVFLTGVMALQIQAEIGMEVQTLGYVFASYFATAALLSASMGRLSERSGPALSLRIGTLLYAVALIGISLVHTIAVLMLFVALAGVGTAFTRSASSLLLARAVTPGRQGLAFGLKNSSIPAAALLSGIAVPGIALTIGWRWAFVIAAGLCIGVLGILPRSIPRPHFEGGDGQTDMPVSLLVWAGVAAALASMAAVSLGAFTVLTAVRAGITEAAAGFLVAMASVVGVASRIGVGHWSDRRPGSQLDIVLGMMAMGAVGYAMIAVGSAPLLWIAVPAAYATGWAYYGPFYLSIVRLNRVAPGAALGITQAGAFSGSIIGPTGLGFLASRYSFTAAWITAGVAAFAGAGVILYIERRVRSQPKTVDLSR